MYISFCAASSASLPSPSAPRHGVDSCGSLSPLGSFASCGIYVPVPHVWRHLSVTMRYCPHGPGGSHKMRPLPFPGSYCFRDVHPPRKRHEIATRNSEASEPDHQGGRLASVALAPVNQCGKEELLRTEPPHRFAGARKRETKPHRNTSKMAASSRHNTSATLEPVSRGVATNFATISMRLLAA